MSSEDRELRDELALAREQLAQLTWSAPGVIISIEFDETRTVSRCPVVSESCRDVLGLEPDDLRADTGVLRARLRPEDVTTMRDGLAEAAQTWSVVAFEVLYAHPDGQDRWLEMRTRPAFTDDGRLRFHGFISDITNRVSAQAALRLEQERAQVTLASIGDAVISTDRDGTVDFLNPVAEHLTGWKSEEARGRPLGEVFSIRSELTGELAVDPATRAMSEGRVVGLANHTELVARDGRTWSIEDSAAPIRDGDGTVLGAVLVFHDVTQQRRLVGELQYRATHDSLTGLINRSEFERQLDQLIGATRQQSTGRRDADWTGTERDGARAAGHMSELRGPHSVCYLDVDQFKIVNDTCGHVAGDHLLQRLADVLRGRLRHTDSLARLGGDEFGVLLRGCDADEALRVADSLRHAVEEYWFTWEDRTCRVSVSVGVVAIDHATRSSAEVMRSADSACYVAKESGRNRVRLYHVDDEQLAQRHGQLQWVHRIHDALQNDRFVLYAQRIHPRDPGQSGIHCEVLLRLRQADGEPLLPGSFLAAAERYQLIGRIDQWVVRHTLQWFATHRDALDQLTLCSVNLSGDSLSDGAIVDEIDRLLTEYDLPAERFCFEITETAAVANLPMAVALIEKLLRRGCRFALDDFGTGLSSFAYLKNLPVSYLKIDGSFVKHVVDDPVDLEIVRSIHEVGKLLGKHTIAEHVETEAVAQLLFGMGVDYLQGYHIGRPQPLADAFGVANPPPNA